jgi:hypothetical protein
MGVVAHPATTIALNSKTPRMVRMTLLPSPERIVCPYASKGRHGRLVASSSMFASASLAA